MINYHKEICAFCMYCEKGQHSVHLHQCLSQAWRLLPADRPCWW